MSARKSSHRTIFLIASSGSPLLLIAASLRSTSKKPFCPMTRPLHLPIFARGYRVRFAQTWREEFFEAPICLEGILTQVRIYLGRLGSLSEVVFVSCFRKLALHLDHFAQRPCTKQLLQSLGVG